VVWFRAARTEAEINRGARVAGLRAGTLSPRRAILHFAAGAVLLTFFFLLFDRLLYFVLRSAADRYYASMTATVFKVGRGWGPKGQGNALVMGSSRARYAFAQNILSARLNHRVFKETQAGKFPKFNYFYYRQFRDKMGPPKLVLYGLDYFMFEEIGPRTGRPPRAVVH
jgi:hypothetical protein